MVIDLDFRERIVLRQHRTMGAAGFGGAFAPIVQYAFFILSHVSKSLALCGAAIKSTK